MWCDYISIHWVSKGFSILSLFNPAASLVRCVVLSLLAFAAASLIETSGLAIVLKLILISAGIPSGYLLLGELTREERHTLLRASGIRITSNP